jgi:hypothetical protein
VSNKPVLNIYLELKDNYIASEQSVAASVQDELEKLDSVYHFNLYKYAYGNATKFLGLRPIAVTFLPQGAFSGYIYQRQSEGAAGDNLKPPHINSSDEVLSLLRAPKVVVEAAPVTEAERAAAL